MNFVFLFFNFNHHDITFECIDVHIFFMPVNDRCYSWSW